ncbi:MAG: flagellar biosynthesis anti-sigma factor FlgM [Bacteriovoracaceae bacterium]|nr:flagellar biosynthesis anti-sigma factor FlgM [Bacteriovoracaceae bacterium]
MNNIEGNNLTTFFPQQRNENQIEKMPQSTFPLGNNQERQQELDALAKKDAKVRIPDAIRDFSKIKKAVDQAPALDKQAQVADLKRKIAAGEYKIDYDALADKIIGSEY